jgi:transmembrane sensor
VVLALAAGLLWRGVPRRGGAETRYAAAVGAHRNLVLSDGSRVVLGPGSELTVLPGYGRSARAVRLRGDGFFAVRHDVAQTFTVATHDAVVRDVGTRFGVQADTAGASRVVVTEGAVSVTPAHGAAAMLRAGDRGRVIGTGVQVERGGSSEEDLAWSRGQLIFRDAPLSEVADVLSRWYGIHLRAEPALAGRHLTADFQGQPPEQVVRIIAATLGAEAQRRGDTVFVSTHALDPGMR